MKKNFFTILLILTVSIIFAHPASEIKLNYDAKTSILTINVLHIISATKVSDPTKHYIKEITVSVNGKEVIIESVKFQQNDRGETSSFLLNVKPNDKVSVKAVCSISGTKIAQITI